MSAGARVSLETRGGMRFVSRGRGRPLVFLHGWCLTHHIWMYAEEHFSTEFRFVAPDLPGFGMSSGLAGPYSLDRYADEVAALLDEFELEDAVVVGFAFGAAVAMTLAARGHRHLRRIVAVAPPGAEFSPYARMPKAMRRDWPEFARRSAHALFHTPQSDATIGWLERIFIAAPLPVAIETVEILSRFDPRSIAPTIAIPQLFVHASEDGVAPVIIGKESVEASRSAELRIIENCGHLIVLDAKDAFHATLGDFLKTH